MNVAILAVLDEGKIDVLFEKIRILDELNKEVGIRAFVWNVERWY
jgi:hypothetical protein